MSDRMDDLLFSIGKEADDAVDYDVLRSTVFAAKPRTGKPRAPFIRTLSAAAALVVVVGAVSLYVGSQTAEENAMDAQMAKASLYADEGAMEEASRCTEESCDTADAAVPQEAPALGSIAGDASETDGMRSYGAMPETGGTASGSDVNGFSSAMSEEDRVYVGIPSGDILSALTALGFTARYEDVKNDLAQGEAFISEAGNYAIWNSGNGMVSVYGQDGTRAGMLEALQGICE